MKARKSVLITDLDNTLFDWVNLWHSCFSAMLEKIVEISGIPEAVLKSEIKAVHQMHGTSEYSFLVEELPSLIKKFPGQDLTKVFAPAFKAYREQRRKELRLYPSVAATLLKIKGTGTKIIGYTESMAFYSNYRVRRLGLDGIFDVIFSPADHDIPKGMTVDQLRKYPATKYEFAYTKHQNTPTGELKPNKDILLSIIARVGAKVEECVYVGDSLVKDVAMAKDTGVTDVWAKYGLTQNSDAYQLLREVTHWSAADVEREKRISEREVKPTIELDVSYSQLFDSFQFGSGQSFYDLTEPPNPTAEEKKNIIEIWKTIVGVQQHFNDISLRIRGLFVTLILALFAAIGFLAEKDLRFAFHDFTIHYVLLVPLGGIIGGLLFYFIDRYWYHRLLGGSVKQGLFIEKKYSFEIPEIGLTDAIGANSPIKLKRRVTKWLAGWVVTDESYEKTGQIHSTAKIELFYKPIVYIFFGVFIAMLFGGAVLINKETLFEMCLRKISSIEWSKSPAAPLPPKQL
jgi:FMN phosphatase YigB (HAD superfamily)